jgi:hypothetical protein
MALISGRLDTTVGVAVGKVLVKNPHRQHAMLLNDSLNIIYIGLGFDPTVGGGIKLVASGGFYEITSINPWDGEVFAIASGASSALLITEVSNGTR